MRDIVIENASGGTTTITVPESLKDITLGEYQEFIVFEEQKVTLQYEKDCLLLKLESKEITEQDYVMDMMLLDAKVGLCYLDQLKVIVKGDLESLSPSCYPILLEMLTFQDTQENILNFKFPEGVKTDVERLTTQIKDAGTRAERRRLTKQVIELKRHPHFILIPVNDLQFMGYIRTSTERKKFPSVPSEVKNAAEQRKIALEDYMKELAKTGGTIKEREQRMKQRMLMAEYAAKFESEKFLMAHNIMAHICVPKGIEYDYSYNEARALSFKKCPMDIVAGCVNFFLRAVNYWNQITVVSSAMEIQEM